MILRAYQSNAISSLRAGFAGGLRRQLLVSPTGSGKTVIACAMVRGALEKGNRVLFLAHRRELVQQAAARLADNGITAGIIMAGHEQSGGGVQVASVQTLINRKPPQAELLIIDEAHRATAGSYQRIAGLYPNAAIIGLTATPFRLDGSGLGALFQGAVKVATIEQLTSDGYLVPVRYWAHHTPDLTGVRRARGDFNLAGFNTALLGNPVNSYQQVGQGARALAFCVNVAHAVRLAEEFSAAGIPAVALSADTPHETRVRALDEFKSGKIRVITNCEILGEGYDCPAAEVVIMARPTASLGLYMQQIGRVLRPYANKAEARVIDHAGNVGRHGYIGDVDADLSAGIAKKSQKTVSVRTCKKCFAVMPSGTQACLLCGAEFPKPEPPKQRHGLLVRIDGVEYARVGSSVLTPSEFLRDRLSEARIAGYKKGWAWYRFVTRFGRKPNRQELANAGYHSV